MDTVFTKEEAAYLAACTDPINDTRNDGIDPATGRIPDGCGRYSYLAKRTAHFTYAPGAGGTLVKGIMKIRCPTTTDNDSVTIATSVTGAAAPTANHVAGSTPWDQPILTVATAGTSFRVVGAAIKVNATSGADATSGSLRGSGGAINIATNDLPNYSTVAPLLEEQSFSCAEGITVRMRSRADFSYDVHEGGWSTLGAVALGDDSVGLPLVMFDGLSADTRLDVRVVTLVEFSGPKSSLFVPMTVSPFSSRRVLLDTIAGNPEIHPVVAKGHSFQTFLKSLGKTWKFVGPLVDVGARAAISSVPGGSIALGALDAANAVSTTIRKPKKKKKALKTKKPPKVKKSKR